MDQEAKSKLANLKDGDEVHVSGRGYDSEGTIAKVARRTSTQIIVTMPAGVVNGAVSEVRFRAKDGRELGVKKPRHISVVTEEHRDRIEKAALLRYGLHGFKWESCSLEQLRALKAVVDGEMDVGPLLPILTMHLNAKGLDMQLVVMPRDRMAEDLAREKGTKPEGRDVNPWDVVVSLAQQVQQLGLPMPVSVFEGLEEIRQSTKLEETIPPSYAFTAVVVEGGSIIGKADKGTKGYTPHRHYGIWPKHSDAQTFADKLNAQLGHTKKSAFEIVASTMDSGRR
jgi:hypothetical protein